ncbi:LacI family DNA-binding transcriptional regulator [Ammoniphilus sp. 3BR4]|uniref:LacI family DNA-binding transcriptional regulator n=1 Tax=Ammoniphilus sp. 3BR4 TaxID=3158265 RepID=UPI003466F398
MSVTIKDIARVANVSYSTVSKALNDSPLVKKKTKDKILEVAKQLGYQPNMVAKSLVSKKSHVIGIVWPTVERPAWSTLVTKINDILENYDYHTLLSINPFDSAVTLFNLFQVDAILIFKEENQMQKKSDLLSSNVPILCYGKPGASPFPAIDVNRRKAIFEAVRYLSEKKHQKISYIGDLSQQEMTQQEKFLGFSEGIIHFGLPTHPEMTVNTGGNSSEGGYRSTKQLLKSNFKPTAIISGSYDITVGIMRALKEEGIKVPQDLSILSYDNIPQMDNFEIPITAVGAPIDSIAENIARSLLTITKGTDQLPFFTEIDVELAERKSCQEPQTE